MSYQQAIDSLLACLQHYADEQSNPVLDVLAGAAVVEQQHYPDQSLNFGAGPWQAFYHCHTREYRFPGEHGHFHLFHQTSGGQWTHVIGLCMDPEGQPLRWFTVNHWVVGGQWCSAEQLLPMLEDTRYPQANTIEQWLLAMVALYEVEIASLLRDRDKMLGVADESTRNDQQRYILSQAPVDLLGKVQTLLNTHNHNLAMTKGNSQ